MLTYFPDTESQWRLFIAIIFLFTIPGLALITWLPEHWRWDALSKWCLAIGLSLATYPVLLYALRFFHPAFKLTADSLLGGLGIISVAFVWRVRNYWQSLLQFKRAELLAIAIFGFTLATRFWLIRDQPFPASPDSLHHALITQLVAQTGRLPETLEPYFQIPLAMYHLGLYALSGSAQILSGAPAHMAVLWVAQALNGLCGVGVYLLLKHRVNHLAGLTGALVVGLFSFQPAWLSSWGRFTVVASGTLLPFAWLLTLMAFDQWKEITHLRQISIWLIGQSALLTAATLLFHYRVAGYYLPLLAIMISLEALQAFKSKRFKRFWGSLGLFGGLTLLLISPAIWNALQAFIAFNEQQSQLTALNPEQRALYFDYPLTWFTDLGARLWLWILAAICGLFGIWRRQWIISISLVWLLTLWLEGNAYLLEIPLLAFTNMSAVLISVYLPLGIIVGAAFGELPLAFPNSVRGYLNIGLGGLLLIGIIIAGPARARERIEQYYFVTESDIRAMNWINQNTPLNARFAVNTHFFSSNFAHGTDAGYWIPYFTQRSTTSGVMLLPLGDATSAQVFLDQSQLVKNLATDLSLVSNLSQLGVSYIYIGQRGNQISSNPVALSIDRLKSAPDLRLVYELDGVAIFEFRDK